MGTEVFHLHQSLVCASSTFFAEAVKATWATGKTRTLQIANVDVEIFKEYTAWVYTSGFSAFGSIYTDWERAAKCYLLGERIADVSFQQAVIDKMINRYSPRGRGNYIPLAAINMIYEDATETSPVRRLLLDFIVSSWTHEKKTWLIK